MICVCVNQPNTMRTQIFLKDQILNKTTFDPLEILMNSLNLPSFLLFSLLEIYS